MGLVKLEKLALEATNRKDYQHATGLYKEIVSQNPNWEHGQAFYNLAGCYEELGNLELAEQSYRRALDIQPTYYIFLGGYASFLSDTGKLREAFDMYVKLLRIEEEGKPRVWTSENQKILDDIRVVLNELGGEIGLEYR